MYKYVSTQGSQICTNSVLDYTTQFTTEQVFKSKEKLLNWIREVGKRNGLVIVFRSKDKLLNWEREVGKRNGLVIVIKTSRITGIKKCGCPFDIRAHRFTTHDEWTLTVVCGLHNHPPAEHLEGHSYAGRLSKDEKALLMDMSKSMSKRANSIGIDAKACGCLLRHTHGLPCTHEIAYYIK
ncbi:uncharacterized protein LOC114313978 [Camellia sinensis]|uniref:uncharacterized protein LOC114313978 n=1 Tax=Camellia sinensis TaxID=4442 RepID=UPI001036894E|nr:uncharacterized protein LOC114313978 [Camellia sinensis]